MTVPDTGPPVAPDDRRGLWGRLRPRMGERPAQPRQPPWRVEGAEGQEPGRPDQVAGAGRSGWSRFWWLLTRAARGELDRLLASCWHRSPGPTVSYTFFLDQVQAGNVGEVTSTGDTIEGELQEGGVVHRRTAATPSRSTRFTTQRPTFARRRPVPAAAEHGRRRSTPSRRTRSVRCWQQMLLGFGPTLLFVGLLIWFVRRIAAAAAGGGARRVRPIPGHAVRAGGGSADDVRRRRRHRRGKGEVTEIVDFLRDPEQVPAARRADPARACCCPAPPGTGKTLLARAVAGEANVPFFSISASEFIEAIVGVGASRVRDLFEQAKKAAPAIIFIDELDAIGRARGGAQSSAATTSGSRRSTRSSPRWTASPATRAWSCWPRPTGRRSSTRPCCGRAGSTAGSPSARRTSTAAGRSSRSTPAACRSAPDVDLAALAASTPGMVGADLRNLVNEAALLAARRGHDQVQHGRLRRRAGEGRAGHARAGSCSRRRSASGPPTTSPGTPCSACSPRAPTRCGRCRSSRAGTRSASRSRAPTPTGTRYSEDVPARPDRRRARRPGRRGGRVRRRPDRGRERPGPGQPHRPADGRPVGHVPEGRPDRGAAGRGHRQPFLGDSNGPSQATRELVDARGRGGSSTSATTGRRDLVAQRDKLDRLAHALLANRDPQRGRGIRRRRGA